MCLKRLFDGLVDVEVRRVDHVIAKVGCRVGELLVNRDPVNAALNLGCRVLQVVVDQPRGATGAAGLDALPRSSCLVR